MSAHRVPGGRAHAARGAALIDVLGALVLLALAGAIVAAAAASALRAVGRAARVERLTTAAARDLAALQCNPDPVGEAAAPYAEPGFGAPLRRAVTVARRGRLWDLAVTLETTTPPPLTVTLATRRMAEE